MMRVSGSSSSGGARTPNLWDVTLSFSAPAGQRVWNHTNITIAPQLRSCKTLQAGARLRLTKSDTFAPSRTRGPVLLLPQALQQLHAVPLQRLDHCLLLLEQPGGGGSVLPVLPLPRVVP